MSKCIAVDLNPASVAVAKRTVDKSLAACSRDHGSLLDVFQGDCNTVMAAGGGFDVIDLDPCGSPAPFLENAVRAVKPGGLLCIASTEDPVIDPELCATRYGK